MEARDFLVDDVEFERLRWADFSMLENEESWHTIHLHPLLNLWLNSILGQTAFCLRPEEKKKHYSHSKYRSNRILFVIKPCCHILSQQFQELNSGKVCSVLVSSAQFCNWICALTPVLIVDVFIFCLVYNNASIWT